MTQKLWLRQGRAGYRFSRDSFLLSNFFSHDGVKSIIDLGAGAGAVSIPLGLESRHLDIVALEIDKGLAKQSKINAGKSGLRNYRVVVGDILCANNIFGNKVFDAVVCNPPYIKAGSGRLGVDSRRAMARHEIFITLEKIIEVASKLLRNGGSLNMTMTFERREEYKTLLARNGFYEARFREVRVLAESRPKIFLSKALSGVQNNLMEEPPLILRSNGGGDSEEYLSISSRYA